jgi:hypothetical protein
LSTIVHMNEKTIEEQLAEKRASLEALIVQSRHKPVTSEYAAVHADVLKLERLVAQKAGEPCALQWELPGIWEGMAMDCTVIGNQLKCLLMFEAKLKSGKFKVLEFCRIAGYKLTDVSDEIIAAHSLAGRGLTAYGAFLVENSAWIKELEQLDRSHSQFDAQKWHNTKHYMLCFKDRMFEALAIEVTLVGETDSRETATTIALQRMSSC